jgi:hypothetical protein
MDQSVLTKEIHNHHNIDDYEINIKSLAGDAFEISATISQSIYKKIIDSDFYESEECLPILKLYKNMLRQFLETQIHSGNKYSTFITMVYEIHVIKLNFVVDLGFVKEALVLELNEYTQESFEQKIDGRIEEIENGLIKRVEDFRPKTYILEGIEYDRREDRFMKNFKWEIAHQEEKEKFIKLSEKYFMLGIHSPSVSGCGNGLPDLQPISISKLEPLCLTITNNVAHLYGWFNIIENSDKVTKEIIIPEEIGIYSGIPRILQHFNVRIDPNNINNTIVTEMGFLVLNENKLSIIGMYHHKWNINGIISKNFFPGYHNDQKIQSSNKKILIIDTHFLIN